MDALIDGLSPEMDAETIMSAVRAAVAERAALRGSAGSPMPQAAPAELDELAQAHTDFHQALIASLTTAGDCFEQLQEDVAQLRASLAAERTRALQREAELARHIQTLTDAVRALAESRRARPGRSQRNGSRPIVSLRHLSLPWAFGARRHAGRDDASNGRLPARIARLCGRLWGVATNTRRS